MALRATQRAWAAGVLATLVLLCGCGRDDRAPKDEDGATPRPRADGQVTVSGDDAIADRLTWRSPKIELVEADVPAVRKRAAAAVTEGRLYEDADAAIPLYLALLKRDPDDARAKTGLTRALTTHAPQVPALSQPFASLRCRPSVVPWSSRR